MKGYREYVGYGDLKCENGDIQSFVERLKAENSIKISYDGNIRYYMISYRLYERCNDIEVEVRVYFDGAEEVCADSIRMVKVLQNMVREGVSRTIGWWDVRNKKWVFGADYSSRLVDIPLTFSNVRSRLSYGRMWESADWVGFPIGFK